MKRWSSSKLKLGLILRELLKKSLFKCLTRGFNGDIGHKTKTELDANLWVILDEAQIKDGETYRRRTLLGFMNGLEC